MVNDRYKQELARIAADIGERQKLSYVYFSRRLGKRRHFLAGWGQPGFTETQHLTVNDQLDLAWQGPMSQTEAKTVIGSLSEIFEQLHESQDELTATREK